MLRIFAAALVFASLLSATSAHAQPPTLTHAVPSAALPGQPTDLTLYGASLVGASGVWSTLPGATIELAPGIEGNGTKADNAVYRITLPAEAAVGVYGLRLATPQGISNLRLIMVDDLPTQLDNGANKTVETAQPLVGPVAIDGACEGESFDYYKFTAAAGQRVSVEVVARRLGSALDPVIRLLDSAGQELAYSDDEGGIGADCRFSHQFAASGDYLLELRDIRYQGGGAHRYRLRVGDFPLAVAPYPLGAQKGSSPKLQVACAALDAPPETTVAVPADVAGGRFTFSSRFAPGQGSAAVSLVASNLVEQVEFEPNDTAETASPISLPGAINGRFVAAKDRDFFEIQGKKGERYLFQGQTRSLGSPSDLFLRIYNAAGGVLVEAEDSGADEGMLDYTFPEDGVYRLMVEDLLHRGGSPHVYRIEVAPYRPGFTLALEAEKFDAPTGGVFVVKVNCVRRDYNGPIALSVTGAGEGLVLANNVIAEGKPDTIMSVTLPAALAAGKPLTINIVGTAKIGEVDFTAKASTLVPLRTGLSGLPYPPSDLDGAVGLGVGPVFADFFQLTADPALYSQLGGAGTLLVKVTKLNGFDDPITLAIDGLPAGVAATVAPIEKGKAEVAIQLAGPGSLAEGDYPFRVTGSAAFQNQPKVVVGAGVLRVVKPLEVSLAPAGPVVAGMAQKVKLTLVRQPAAAAAVTISLKNLPAGVTAPPEVTIAEGQNEVDVDLTAAADAKPGQALVTAVATTKVKEKTVAVESLPVAIQVSTP